MKTAAIIALLVLGSAGVVGGGLYFGVGRGLDVQEAASCVEQSIKSQTDVLVAIDRFTRSPTETKVEVKNMNVSNCNKQTDGSYICTVEYLVTAEGNPIIDVLNLIDGKKTNQILTQWRFVEGEKTILCELYKRN